MTPFDAWKARPGRPTLVALLEASQGRVFAICLDVLHHRQDAEEAAQEALLEIVLGVEGVRDADHYEGWLATVAFRTALDRKKSRRRRRERELQVAGRSRDEGVPYEGLHDSIARLPEEDRALILERYFDRRTFDEMGKRRGLSDVAVRKRIEKACEKLKRMLGCGFPGGFWKGVGTVGATAMKTKAVAGIAVIVIPFLLLGGGVWIAVSKRSPNTSGVADAPSTAQESNRAPVPQKVPTVPAIPAESLTPAALRKRMLELLAQIDEVSERREKAKRDAEAIDTEPEHYDLRMEFRRLEQEGLELRKSLRDLALQDAAVVVGVLKTKQSISNKLSLVDAIRPALESESSSVDAPSGPLLRGLQALASGEPEDKGFFLQFIAGFAGANREVGELCFDLMQDTDVHVRLGAQWAVWQQALRGDLKAYFIEQAPLLRAMAEAEPGGGGSAMRGGALKALAVLGLPEADEYVLRRFESMREPHDATHEVQAVLHVASRSVGMHDRRIVDSINRALDQPFKYVVYHPLVDLALYLPEPLCLETLRTLASKPPKDEPGAVVAVQEVIRKVEAGQIESLRRSKDHHRNGPFMKRRLASLR